MSSKAGRLLYRLDRIGHPEVNEQTPEEQQSDDEVSMGATMTDPQNPNAVDPTSPFSKDTHNPDGSMKMAPDEQPIDDRGRFVVRRRR